MQFRIASSFSDGLIQLTDQEQKAVKTTAFDLQLNPANPGFQFHRLNNAKDPNFWSVRVSRDLRIIVHRTQTSLMLCYVDHHDAAYSWAERRKIERHPKTGAAQLVEIRETVREVVVPVHVVEEVVEELLFGHHPEEDLLGWGVPPEWISEVREATEASVLELAEHLPAEAAEALLAVAVGEEPPVAVAVSDASVDPFEHPDAQRRFRSLSGREELERALDFPWEKWTVFLHPSQRSVVEKRFNGPARVSGSAGTGKTVVALHRAVHLARENSDARVLLTTFSDALAHALRRKLRRLAGNEPKLMERMDVLGLCEVAERLSRGRLPDVQTAQEDTVRQVLGAIGREQSLKFSENFVFSEWSQVVDAWHLEDWEAYREVPRRGRRTRISEQQRKSLWKAFSEVRTALSERGLLTRADRFHRLAVALEESSSPAPYDYVIADESQDLGVAELRLVVGLTRGRPDGLFFAGDLGQRIFQAPFSWKDLGVDVRGRSLTLRVNYRTSHQIRSRADRLLPSTVADVDGLEERRAGTTSVFNGPAPHLELFENEGEEAEAVGGWLCELLEGGEADDPVMAEQIGVFVRSAAEIDRARSAVEASGADCVILDENRKTAKGKIAVSTMHLAKGMEFRAVAVMACDEDVIPQVERMETAGGSSELAEIFQTERHLLYVACTRARDRLWVSGVEPGSEFLEDMG